MTRIPTISDALRAPGRVGVPSARLDLPTPRSVGLGGESPLETVGRGVERLAGVLRRAHAARILTSYEASLIEGIGQAEQDAGKADPAIAQETFTGHQSFVALEEQITQQGDRVLQSRMTEILTRGKARALNRVRHASAIREGIKGKAENDRLGDQLLGSVARGQSSQEAIDQFAVATERLLGTSYTETSAKDAVDAFAARAIRHEYQHLLSLNIPDKTKKRVIDDLLESDTALSVLPADEIARRKATVGNVAAQRRADTLARIQGRAVSFDRSDNLAGLEDLIDTLGAMSGPDVDDLTVDVQERIKASRTTLGEAEKLLSDVASGEPKTVTASPRTLDAATRIVQDTTGDTSGFLRQLLENGLDIPPSISKQIKADAQPATLNLTRFYEQVNTIAQFDTSQAERIARESGTIGETAYFSTRKLTDSDEIAARLDILGDQTAATIAEQSRQLLTAKGGKDPEINLREQVTEGVAEIQIGLPPRGPSPLNPFAIFVTRPPLKVSPDQITEAGSLFTFHLIRHITQAGADPENAAGLALNDAVTELIERHQQIVVVGKGRYLFPREALELGDRFSADQASSAIATEAAAMLRDAGPQSDLLVSRPIIDERNAKSFTPITGPAGIVGFIEWDGNSGVTRRITASTDGEKFTELRRMMSQRPPEQLAPHQDLTRNAQQQVMTDQIADTFVDMAFDVFRARNDGRLPDPNSDADRAVVEAIVNMLSEQAKWNEP